MAYYPPFPGRDELLALALLELARERGVHDMSIRSLASAVRAAPGSLTYHHRDKDTILATCARHLGIWLHRDLADRLAVGGVAMVLPKPTVDRDGEPDDVVRWRVWIQLSAYALSSPAVAAAVRAGEDRMMRMLEAVCETSGKRGVTPLVLWAALETFARSLLQPGSELRWEAAAAAVQRMVE